MTTIGDLLGKQADELARSSLSVGDVHLLPLSQNEGITPKEGETREKLFVILGFNAAGDIIGGVVVNSKVNLNLPTVITDYLMPISASQFKFLKHDSFVNCSSPKFVKKEKFNNKTYRGRIEDTETLALIIGTLFDSPYTSAQQLREFGIGKL